MRASHVLCGLSVLALVAACSGDDTPITIGDAGGGDAADGALDAGPDVTPPPGCDLAKDVKDSPACIDDGIGLFVDGTNGDDDKGAGTKASPYKSIGKALSNSGAKLRVYVCAGTYAEDVKLGTANAVSLYGGVACKTWAYDGSKPTIGAGRTPLVIDAVPKAIVLADVAIVAAPGVAAGESSVAAFVNASGNVTLRRASLTAGAGKAGAGGSTGSNWSAVQQSDPTIAGNNASGATGGATHACTLCVDAVQSSGGSGGGGGLTPNGGAAGAPSLGANPPTDGAGGGSGCTAGHNGASAGAGTNGGGATSAGELAAAGWKSTTGGDGKNGGPGQGGGGGGGSASVGSGGGGGGACGGCGGAKGTGGGSGGSSIALASLGSGVTLVECELHAGDGGAGGDGAGGQTGQAGGFAGVAASPGCAGGNGGTGGTGGAGGGGAGGLSVATLYKGTAPVVDGATSAKTTVSSNAAAKGKGGAVGVNDGSPGAAVLVLELK